MSQRDLQSISVYLLFFEHEDQPNETQFDSEDLDELESYDFDLDETDDSSHTDAEILEQLCLPFSTLEPSLPDHELLRLEPDCRPVGNQAS